MSNRIRLTQRRATDNTVKPPAYPGNVNQPDRTDPAYDAYHTFEPTLNHWTPDMRHEWKDDERDEIGFGIPQGVKEKGAPVGDGGALVGVPNPDNIPGKGQGGMPQMAASRVAANKAVKLAVLLLGEKVEEDVIEEQARDFLRLGSEAMDRTLGRFASTQKFYADDDDDDACASKKADSKDLAEEMAPEKAAKSKKADSTELAESDDEVPPAIKTPADPQVVDKQAAAKKSADEAEDKTPESMDIELQSSDVDEPEEDAEADAKLARIFEGNDGSSPEDEDAEPVVAKSKTAKKNGITRLGGQPKVASDAGSDPKDLSNLWASAPDVSEVFR